MPRPDQVPAVGAVGQVGAEGALSPQWLQHLASPRVPDRNGPILTGRGDLRVVGAKGHVVDRTRVLYRLHVVVALPLQEVPLPAAQVFRAVAEQLLGAADVAGGQLAPRQGG